MVHLQANTLSHVEALAALLNGRQDVSVSDALLDVAYAHGVEPLIARHTPTSLPADAGARLRAALAGYEALAAIREAELRRVLDALAAAGVDPVVIKGAHLAHVLYVSPALRPRSDTDLVLEQDRCERAAEVFARLGYRRAQHVRGKIILGQCHFRCVDAAGVEHALDVHWRIASPLVFRHVLPPNVLRDGAVNIPALGPAAFGPALPHALLIACVHLIAHHRNDPLLLWLYEIAQLVNTLDDSGRRIFVSAATRAGVTTVCADALARAGQYFANDELTSLTCCLRAATRTVETSARLLSATRPVDELWLDFKVSAGWRERMTLLKEHLWPDADYMRATGEARWLPAAYVHRAMRGALRWTSATNDRTAAPGAPSADSAAASPFRALSKTSR